MCGRFVLYSRPDQWGDWLDLGDFPEGIEANYNIGPSRTIPAVIHQNRGYQIIQATWGLVPFWGGDPLKATRIINARSETVQQKPVFRRSFRRRRCLIPADAFYEWKTENGMKQPYLCRPASVGPFFFAGLWDIWQKGDADAHYSSLIITIPAGGALKAVHQRMPLVVAPKHRGAWLGPDSDLRMLKMIMNTGYVSDFLIYRVSTRVNNPRLNEPDLIRPLDSSTDALS